MTIKFHNDFEQGSQQWLDARLGLMTASEMKLVITATLKIAANDKVRAHVLELAAQRITRYVEPRYVSDDMLRGHEDEVEARIAYEKQNGVDVQQVGFLTNDKWGFTVGYSPDGLVGDDGQIECKSRRQKYQIKAITELLPNDDDIIQVQTGLLVSERKWCDYISYSGGLPMLTLRVYPDPVIHAAIVTAATQFEGQVLETVKTYNDNVNAKVERMVPTERIERGDII